MNELLSNPAVQAALVLAIVTGLQLIVAWLKQKFPTQTALVEANWCYLQPIVAGFINGVKDVVNNPASGVTEYGGLITKSLTEFQAQYKLFEGKQPSKSEMDAAKAELLAALKRLIEG